MDEDLPTEYDVIVVGTGMTESIIAAAASRVGKKVLHLDSNEYYGGLWASFNFEGLQKWLDDCRQPAKVKDNVDPTLDTVLNDGESLITSGNQFSSVFNIDENWYIREEIVGTPEGQLSSKETQTVVDESHPEDAAEEVPEAGTAALLPEAGEGASPSLDDSPLGVAACPKQWSQADVKKEYRKFNLDLAPKLLFARGSLVELLISSNIARYAEFRSVTRVLTWLNGCLEPVPCSRADVFSTKHVSVVEKRMLMKLLTACMEHDPSANDFQEFEGKPFVEYLRWKKLTPNLIHYVLFAIAMATEETLCEDGVARTQRFLNSLGRYGNTPFLWPMYGSGELPQCFCRLCAVFGGLYHLKRAADSLIISASGRCEGIVSSHQRLAATNLVLGVGYTPASLLPPVLAPRGLSRGIFITDRSMLPADKESLTLLQFPPAGPAADPVTVIEIGPSTNACPAGLYVVHMTCRQRGLASEDLAPVVAKLLRAEWDDGSNPQVATQATQTTTPKKQTPSGGDAEDQPEGRAVPPTRPQVLWSLTFNCPDTSSEDPGSAAPDNVFLCSGPDLDLDLEFAVNQARDVFKKMYPDCEFLPRAPDPEEIVLEGEEGAPGPVFEGGEESKTEDSAAAATATEE